MSFSFFFKLATKMIFIVTFSICINNNIQAQNQWKSIYKYSGFQDSITINNKHIPKSRDLYGDREIKLSIGDVIYENWSNDTLSNTTIRMVANVGINVQNSDGNEPVAYIMTNFVTNTYFAKNGLKEKALTYHLPKLKDSGIKKIVNGYLSNLYTYTNKDGLHIELWFSKKLSNNINIGFRYAKLGGLVKIIYYTPKQTFSFNLIDFSVDKSVLSSNKNTQIEFSRNQELHPMFTVDE